MGSGGDSIAQEAEMMQMQLQSSLIDLFGKQYANQQSLMNYVKPALENMVSNPQGLSPSALSATRTSATDAIAAQTENAQKGAGAVIAAHGGAALPSGVAAQVEGGITEAGAAETAASQNQITMQNEQLKLQNYWKGIGALSGQAELEAPVSYANAAVGAGNSVANLSQAVLASQQAGWQDVGGIMSGIGGLATGIGGIGTGFGLCWVAASFWGWESEKTKKVRWWILSESPLWFRRFYIRHGKWISGTPIRWLFRPIFEHVLRSR